MSTSKTESVKLKDSSEYVCGFCFGSSEESSDLMRLPCAHIGCRECITQSSSCQICGVEHDSTDIDELPKVIIKKEELAKEAQTSCDRCQDHHPTPAVAISFCIDCAQTSCKKHKEFHDGYFGKSHNSVCIEEYEDKRTSYCTAVTCDEHHEETVKLACKECYQLACPKCLDVHEIQATTKATKLKSKRTSTAGGGLFGGTSAAGGGLFGGTTTTPQLATGGGLCGSTTAAGSAFLPPAVTAFYNCFGTRSSSSLFGTTTQPTAVTGGGLFGQPTLATSSTDQVFTSGGSSVEKHVHVFVTLPQLQTIIKTQYRHRLEELRTTKLAVTDNIKQLSNNEDEMMSKCRSMRADVMRKTKEQIMFIQKQSGELLNRIGRYEETTTKNSEQRLDNYQVQEVNLETCIADNEAFVRESEIKGLMREKKKRTQSMMDASKIIITSPQLNESELRIGKKIKMEIDFTDSLNDSGKSCNYQDADSHYNLYAQKADHKHFFNSSCEPWQDKDDGSDNSD